MYITQQKAKEIDSLLFTKFELLQLMELAGLSCAMALNSILPRSTILVICGPGNNGGDGLVCARHLKLMGFNVTIHVSLKCQRKFKALVEQCEFVGVIMVDCNIEELSIIVQTFDYLIDAIFGFGFHGELIGDWSRIINIIKTTTTKTIAIDVPSGSQVNEEMLWTPDILISLTLPKLCTTKYTGIHFLGGHFLSGDNCTQLGIDYIEYGTGYMFKRLS